MNSTIENNKRITSPLRIQTWKEKYTAVEYCLGQTDNGGATDLSTD